VKVLYSPSLFLCLLNTSTGKKTKKTKTKKHLAQSYTIALAGNGDSLSGSFVYFTIKCMMRLVSCDVSRKYLIYQRQITLFFLVYQDNKTARIWERNRTQYVSLTWCCNSPSNRLLLLYAKQPDRSAPRCEPADVTSQPTHSSSTITTRINWLRYMERANCRLFMCAADAPRNTD
jgi:hypothetical protein